MKYFEKTAKEYKSYGEKATEKALVGAGAGAIAGAGLQKLLNEYSKRTLKKTKDLSIQFQKHKRIRAPGSYIRRGMKAGAITGAIAGLATAVLRKKD
jgi:hypothetical protein